MTLWHKDNMWKKLISSLTKSLGGLKVQPLVEEKEEAEWRIIKQHSAAKLSKSWAEQYYAPRPLPPELSRSLNERIENSQNQLMRILNQTM